MTPTSTSTADTPNDVAEHPLSARQPARLVRWQRKKQSVPAPTAPENATITSASSVQGEGAAREVDASAVTSTKIERKPDPEAAGASHRGVAVRSSAVGRPRSPLTEFILSLPADLPAAEVVAKASAAGMPCSVSNVQRVRGLGRLKSTAKTSKKTVAKKTAPAGSKPAPKVTPSSTPRALAAPMSKSDFVRSQPATATAAEVVAAARATGIKLDPYLVYKVRGRAAGSTSAKKATPKSTAPERSAVTASPRPNPPRTPEAPAEGRPSASELLRALAAEIGLGRAIELLHEQRSAVLRVLGA